jgi:hypothetical protein
MRYDISRTLEVDTAIICALTLRNGEIFGLGSWLSDTRRRGMGAYVWKHRRMLEHAGGWIY